MHSWLREIRSSGVSVAVTLSIFAVAIAVKLFVQWKLMSAGGQTRQPRCPYSYLLFCPYGNAEDLLRQRALPLALWGKSRHIQRVIEFVRYMPTSSPHKSRNE